MPDRSAVEMSQSLDQYKLLSSAVSSRSSRRALHVDVIRLKYANDVFFEPVSDLKMARALYVGVGHGLDAVMSLIQGKIGKVVGVDPFDREAGNDEQDLFTLEKLVTSLGLSNCFELRRQTIEEYLQESSIKESFDLVICNDVLHHIFWTEKRLSESEDASRAVDLFSGLLRCVVPGGRLAISDVMRNGFRPWLCNRGLLRSSVIYPAKQDWDEWARMAQLAGWSFYHRETYVPFALRTLRPLLKGKLGGVTIGDKYFLYFNRL